MCLVTKDPEIKIAKENIVCYKEGVIKRNAFISCLYGRFVYSRFIEPNYVDLSPESDSDGDFKVNSGYHSYNDPIGNAVFIIPKGQYYINGFSNHFCGPLNRVSSMLVYIGRRRHPLTWLRLKFINLGLIEI